MKNVIAILVLFAVSGSLMAAGDGQATGKKSSKTATAPKAPPKPAAPQPVTIPKDAVPMSNGAYSYTDSKGKKWIYTNTPFGISRVEDMGPPPAAGPELTKAIDKGEVVRFERPSPFGTMTWEKKKTELTDEERQMVEAQNPSTHPPDAQTGEPDTAKPDAGPGK